MYYSYNSNFHFEVTSEYSRIELLSKLYPYSKFRKFREEEDAWAYVQKNRRNSELTSIERYGDTFNNIYIQVQYFIDKDSVYYNIDTSKLGYVRLEDKEDGIIVENRSGLIKVQITEFYLNPNLISSHLIAINRVLRILGNFVDVDIIIPNVSIYYAINSYTGTKRSIVREVEKMRDRKGKVSFTLKKW